MFIKVFIIGFILRTVVSKFDNSPNKIIESTSETINRQNCEDTKQWLLVDNYNRGFNTFSKSSGSVLIIPDSFELYVHVTTGRKGELMFTLSNEVNDVSVNYVYNGSGQESEFGWCKLLLPIGYSGFTYINLLGYNDDSENVLMDPFSYKLKIYQIKKNNGDQAVVLYIHGHETSVAVGTELENTNNIKNKKMEIVKNENEELNTEDRQEDMENDINKQKDDGRLLGTWAIALIVVAAVTVLSLLVVGAYQLGVTKGLAKNPLYIEDIEPPRVLRIPRVRGVTDSPINEFI